MWFNSNETENCEIYSQSFVNTIQQNFKKAFPIIKKKIKKNNLGKKWITSNIIKSSNNLKDLYKIAKANPCFNTIHKYRKHEHRLLVNTTKKKYLDNIIMASENKMKTMWSIINKNLSKSRPQNNSENITLQKK